MNLNETTQCCVGKVDYKPIVVASNRVLSKPKPVKLKRLKKNRLRK